MAPMDIIKGDIRPLLVALPPLALPPGDLTTPAPPPERVDLWPAHSAGSRRRPLLSPVGCHSPLLPVLLAATTCDIMKLLTFPFPM